MSFEVFVYGSNLFPGKFAMAAPSARPLYKGRLAGHQLLFHKLSDDRSGKADAHYTAAANDVVWGVVFTVDDQDRAPLDTSEGGYECQEVSVIDEEGRTRASGTYLAKKSRVTRGLLPYDWYLAYVIAGAEHHGLPADYVGQLRKFKSKKCDDLELNERHWGVLGRRT